MTKPKLDIPLHENLQKEDYEEKAEPVPFAEMKIVATKNK